jgi:hypothetical protein
MFLGGWMDGWVGGWMGGSKSRSKDCLQQSKIFLVIYNAMILSNLTETSW